MTNQLALSLPSISIHNGKVITTSRAVASYFNKNHFHIMEKIKSLDCSKEFLTLNFSMVQFSHNNNVYYEYEMTKDGFIFLVMGFTGKKAAQFKEAYIKAFNEMEKALLNQSIPKIESSTITVNRTNLKCLVHHMIWLKEFYFSNNLYDTFKALNSDFGVRMHDHIKDGYCVAWLFKKELQI